MKKLSLKKIALLCTMFLATGFTICTKLVAQTVYQSQNFDIKLNGTSNVHDWEMKADKGTSKVSFAVDTRGKITSISKLSFTLPAKNLKSGHTGMDNNTYKALNTDANPSISFTGTTSTVTSTGANSYQVTSSGKMTIAGTTRQIELVAIGNYNPSDKSFTVVGVKKMKMTDYNVKPPKALMGTIRAGDDISISYNVKFKR